MSYDPNNPARREWATRRAAQIDWMHTHPHLPAPGWIRTTVGDIKRAFDLDGPPPSSIPPAV